MRPLISGAEAKRYVAPASGTYILFPYAPDTEGAMRLIPEATLRRDYPKAWAHLTSFKPALEGREARQEADTTVRPFADAAWYRFGRNQNIDKQDWPKLIVAQTVPNLRLCYDESGGFALNNVRVNGIVPTAGTDPWFLLGILNAPVADFVFRRTAKPKDNNYFEANRQFIIDLPIPHADAAAQAPIAALARDLQRLHTERHRILDALARRLDAASRVRAPEWLFHGLPAAEEFALNAPASLTARERRARSTKLREAEIARREAAVGAALRPGARLSATLSGGELALLADGVPVLDHVFVTTAESAFVHAVWRRLAAVTTVSERMTGKALCDLLRRVPPATQPALVEGVVSLAAELDAVEQAIAVAETALDEASFALYGLSAEERAMVLGG